MEHWIKKTSVLFISLIIFLTFSEDILAEELPASPYYSLKTEDIQKNARRIKNFPLRFHEIFISSTNIRYTEAEAKGFSQEKYVFFRGKLIKNCLYIVERGTETEKSLNNTSRNEEVTFYGFIKASDKIIIEINKIEKGWNIKTYDEIPLPKNNRPYYGNSENQKNMLKVPYHQSNKKYKLYIPF